MVHIMLHPQTFSLGLFEKGTPQTECLLNPLSTSYVSLHAILNPHLGDTFDFVRPPALISMASAYLRPRTRSGTGPRGMSSRSEEYHFHFLFKLFERSKFKTAH